MAKCRGSGRIVSQRNLKRAIYTAESRWIGYCPHHQGASVIVRNPQGARYLDHQQTD